MTKMTPKSSSVSQNNTEADCTRKWGYSSISYLPQTPNRSTSRGTALHDQLEIYLDVDENGISRRTGKEPQMFPKGWEIQKDYFGKKVIFVLEPAEQNMIKKAIAKGIEESVIVREPNAVVEFEKKILLNEYLYFTLKIDYAYGFNIEDHKSCTNFNYSTVSDPKHERYIGKDVQLKCYAYWWAKEYSEMSGEPIPDEISICHNQFMIDPRKGTPVVRKVPGMVKYSDCEATWNEVYKSALRQMDYRLKVHNGEMKVSQLPRDVSACGKYSGCPYKSVCMGMESPDMYKKRIELKIEELSLRLEQKDEVMGFNMADGATSEQAKVLEELEAKSNTETAEEVTTQVEKVEEKSNTTTTEEVQKTDAVLEKEIRASIKAVEERLTSAGMESYIKGSPEISELKEQLKPIVAREKVRKEEAKAAREAAKEAEEAAKAEAKAKEEAEAKAKADKEKAEFDAKSEEEKLAQINAKLEAAENKEKEVAAKVDKVLTITEPVKSRSSSVVVFVNCNRIQGKLRNSISLQEVFAKKSAQLAVEAGVDSYFDLDTFPRREQFYKAKEAIVAELKGFDVHARVCGPDEQALLNAIMAVPGVEVMAG